MKNVFLFCHHNFLISHQKLIKHAATITITYTHTIKLKHRKHIRPIYCTLYEKFLENYFLSQYIIHFCTCHKQMKHDHEVIFYRLYFFSCVSYSCTFVSHIHTQIDETRVGTTYNETI